jgi:hypothetical protein
MIKPRRRRWEEYEERMIGEGSPMGETERKRPLLRSRRRREDNIKMDLRAVW